MSSKFSCPAQFSGPPVTAFVTVTIIVYDNVGPTPIAGASVGLAGPSGATYSGVTNGAGVCVLTDVGAPALFVTLTINAVGFDLYHNTFTIETLPVNVVYVVGPPGTAVGAQNQLPQLTVSAGPGFCNTSLALSQPAGIPARPNLRWFRGNFSGHVVPGMPLVPGASAVPGQIFTPFLDRYTAPDQATILADFAALGATHYVVSWPDSRDGNGQSIAQFVATCQSIQAAGMYTVVFLLSKDFDPYFMSVPQCAGLVDGVIAALDAVGAADIYCVGWELSLWMDPGQAADPPGSSQFQAVINHISGLVFPARPLYVHFQVDYTSFSPNGDFTNVFWNTNVGKLTGCLWQQDRAHFSNCTSMQYRLADTQIRFGGAFGFPAGQFDLVSYEQGANEMFYGSLTEAQGDALGLQAIHSPVPNPGVPIMGYCNGCTGWP